MKKLLIVLLLLLSGCVADKKFELYRDNSLKGNIQGNVNIYSSVNVDDNDIEVDFTYAFARNDEGSTIEIINENSSSKLISKDGISFLVDEDILYSYDEYDSLYQLLLPYDLKSEDILDYNFKDGKLSFKVKDDLILNMLSIDGEIIDNNFNYQIVDDKIVSEDVLIDYLVDGEYHNYQKKADYNYDDVDIDLSLFDFMQEDYQQYNGSCIFDNGTSSIVNDIIIENGKVLSLHMIQSSHLDVIANMTSNVDDYMQQLDDLYNNISGIRANIYLDDDRIISDLYIDVENVDDAGLALLDISRDGNELMQRLQAKGYICD